MKKKRSKTQTKILKLWKTFSKKNKFNLTLSRIVMASIIVYLLFYFWGLIFQTKGTVKHVQEQKIQEIKDKNNEKHFRKTFEYGSSRRYSFEIGSEIDRNGEISASK